MIKVKVNGKNDFKCIMIYQGTFEDLAKEINEIEKEFLIFSEFILRKKDIIEIYIKD